ncbi:hypothetical protein DM02DRAFT_726224 [Periconia macrospinosa]|uniref:Chromo domain-containing protein n=1 Tax=Periconia macrospinosa TaxID=97972 RepID=A0A2V1E053_9PLEO|nr:hypothetical protein DM02DRAFT_726224 [Periconia macrospinosa]
MSARGNGNGNPTRGRGRGGASRGRGRGRGKTMTWEWESYKPGPDVYDSLFHIRRAPPTIVHTLPNKCPIPHAQSRIIRRQQTDDGLCRNFYTVRVTYDATDEGTPEGKEEVLEVDISQIDNYVSARELERYEAAESRAEAEAEAAAQRAEAEELARHRLEKNARGLGAGRGRGNRILTGLGLNPETESLGARRGRGRPRARGRGRGSWRGRGGSAMAPQESAEEEMMDVGVDPAPLDDENLNEDQDDIMQRIIAESEGTSSEEDNIKLPSPELARSSFVANSALPVSPVASHRIPRPAEILQEISDEDGSSDSRAHSMSSAAAQLQFERYERYSPEIKKERSDGDRHHARKRMKHHHSIELPILNHSKGPLDSYFTKEPLAKPALLESDSESSSSDTSEDPITVYVPPKPKAKSTQSTNARTSSSKHHSKKGSTKNTIPVHRSGMKQAHITKTYDDVEMEDGDDENEDEFDDDDDEEEDDAEEYVVETIVNHNFESGIKYYLVKWEGYENSDWLQEDELEGAKELIVEYHEKLIKNKGRRPVR